VYADNAIKCVIDSDITTDGFDMHGNVGQDSDKDCKLHAPKYSCDESWPDHDSKECNYVGDGNGHWNIDFEGQPIKLVDGYCQDAPEWCK